MAGKKRVPKALALPTTTKRPRGPGACVMDDAGNRTFLTPQIADQACELMLKGYWPTRIAVMCGISPKTLHAWVERGVSDEGIEPYASFADRFIQAEAESAAELYDVIRDAALGRHSLKSANRPPDLRVAVWLLERRYGEEWKGAGVSALGVLLHSETEHGRQIRAKVDGWLQSLPPEAVAHGREIGLALDDPRPVDGSA